MAESIFERLAATALDADADAEMREAERLRVQEQRRERLEFARPAVLPSDVDAIVRDELGLTHALKVIRAWRERFHGQRAGGHKPIVALIGPRGYGKTVAGAWLLAHEGGRYVSALELAKRLVSGHWRDVEWADQVFTSRVVVLDDVGTEPLDEQAKAAMFEFVNRRQSLARAFTLITANLTREEFSTRYGDRTADRIEHVGHFVEAKGRDLRHKQASV